MSEYIQKKCPRCGAILTIRNQSGLESTTVTCPVCHQTYPFGQMREVNLNPNGGANNGMSRPAGGGMTPPPMSGRGAVPPAQPGRGYQQPGGYQQQPEGTMYPGAAGMNNGQYGSADKGTDYRRPINRRPGVLVQRQTNMRYPLRMGRNIIGRQSQSSQSTIQLNTGMSRRLSRQHLAIEVTMDQMGNVIHLCSLCKPNCNDTFINGAQIQFRDKVILRHGMVIRLPDAELQFIIEDNDRTEYNNNTGW